MPGNAAATGTVVVVGSLNADLVAYCERLPDPGETVRGYAFATSPGGKSANQAAAAGRLGADVTLVGAVGDDAHGQLLLDSVTDAGADVSHVVRRDGVPTGVALITVDDTAENSIVIVPGANGTLDEQDIPPGVFADAAVVCLCLEVSIDTVLAAARSGREAGATVVFNLSPSAEVPAELLGLTDVLLVNVHEAGQVLGSGVPSQATDDTLTEWAEVATLFEHQGVAKVVVTLGAGGSVVLDPAALEGERVTPVAPTTVTPVDTTGAGDCFTGALATRLAVGDDLVASSRFASVAAALATTAKGTQAAYPSAERVREILES